MGFVEENINDIIEISTVEPFLVFTDIFVSRNSVEIVFRLKFLKKNFLFDWMKFGWPLCTQEFYWSQKKKDWRRKKW